MSSCVAYVLRVFSSCLIAAALVFSAAFGQTSKRAARKRPVQKATGEVTTTAANDTLKLCQGVKIPPGYVIVAYITSSACPHGAYVLKKQDSYSENVSENYAKARQPSPATTASAQPGASGYSTPSGGGSAGDTQLAAGSSGSEVVDPFATIPSSQPNTSSPSSNASVSVQPSVSPGSRPRRVAGSTANDNVAVVDDEPERPARAPKWAGSGPLGSPAVSSTDSADVGPEEVEEGDVVRVDTSLVTVPVSVLDRQGRFIPDLKREDFKVFENGVEQPIAYWEPADKPFTVALLLDTSPSTQFHLWQIKEAAVAFAKQLRPQDRVLIVSFNEQVLLLTEVTNDLNVISSVIEQNANMGTATRVYDAVHLVIKERLNKIKGRKAIVLFTDGVDTASYQSDYNSTMRQVEELDVLIYPIKYDTTDYMRVMQGLNNGSGGTTVVTTSNGPFGTTTSRVTYGGTRVTGPNGGPLPGSTQADYDRADRYLKELADKTAGRLYYANDTTQLADAFSRIAEELRRQYSLGYYPQGGAAAADRRQIRVRVNRSNVAVKARDSYVRGGGQ